MALVNGSAALEEMGRKKLAAASIPAPGELRGYRDHDGSPGEDACAPVGIGSLAPRLADTFAASLERVTRRSDGREKPIALPWPVLADHFGGGLWPGLHVVNAGTGVGKTQLALQAGAHAAKSKIPVLYIGLELGQLDLALRMLGEEARVPWSHLWTGKAAAQQVDRVRAAAAKLAALPFHYEVARPHGFPPSAILSAVEALRVEYPETDGGGSCPMLVIVDFLQLVGDELGDEKDLRVRIARASYVLREIANRLGVAVLCISSVARERYKLLAELHTAAGLTWEADENERPIKRRILDTDAIIGAGKESGEIEYAADSVSVIGRVAETWDGSGFDVVFATAKGRATGATWSPLRFTGFRYEQCEDGGGRMLDAWKEAADKRQAKSDQKKAAKEEKKRQSLEADADAIRAYVARKPGCTVREARVHTVNDNARRWNPAVALLGPALIHDKKNGLTLAVKVTS